MQLSEKLFEEKQWDAYYIFRQMCAKSAFKFCANSQDLYPGAPLYTRSDVVLPISADFLTKKDRKMGQNAKYLQSQTSNTPVIDTYDELPTCLQKNWPATDAAVSHYYGAKLELNLKSNLGPSTSTAPTASQLEEHMWWGLNLIKYPVSVHLICFKCFFFEATVPIYCIFRNS